MTSAVTMLAVECAKGVASGVGKSLWAEIKSLLTWKEEPEIADLAIEIAKKLQASPDMAQQVEVILKNKQSSSSTISGALIAHVSGGKVIAGQTIHIQTVNM